MGDPALRQEISVLRQESQALRALVAGLQRAMQRARPQVLGLNELCLHWPAWGPRRISQEMERRAGLRFARGQRVAVPVAVVDAIDDQLAGEAAEILAQHDPRRRRPDPTASTTTTPPRS